MQLALVIISATFGAALLILTMVLYSMKRAYDEAFHEAYDDIKRLEKAVLGLIISDSAQDKRLKELEERD